MSTGRLIIGVIFIIVGLSALTNIDIFHYIIPALFIFLGIRILMGQGPRGEGYHGNPMKVHENELNDTYIMSGTHKRIEAADFAGGKAVVIFGGEEIDLTGVKTKAKQLDLELNAIFGGIKVTVPKTWDVSSQGTGVLGGFDNKTERGDGPRLTVRGAAIFGGVEISN